MSIENLSAIPIETFKGVETLPDAQDVELGKAVDSKNVEYHLGSSVQSRSGRSNFLTVDGGVHVLSMGEFALLDGITRRLIILGSDGKLWKENGDQTQTLIESGLGQTVRLSQQTAFGRQYFAFSDGKTGTAPPRYYNDVEMFPVTQGGPGVEPNATDGSLGGNVDAGTRFVRVVFERKDGYRTAPSPAQKVVTSGGRTLRVTDIPRGPSNIARRIIICSAAVSADIADTIRPDGVRYFFIPDTNMVINDNTTTGPVDLDFTDAALTAAEDVTELQFLIVLPEQAHVVLFNNRLVWGGGKKALYRVADDGPLNLDFNGGFEFPVGVNGRVPNGWTGIHPGCQVVDDVPGATGAVFRIVADGASQRGTIENNVRGLELNKFIRPNTAYGGRLRLARSPGLTQGTVSLYFLTAASSQLGQAVGVLTVDASQLTTYFQEFSGPVFPATPVLPTDLVLRISGGKGGDGQTTVLGPVNEYIDVDLSAFYELKEPYTTSRLYVSDAGLPGNYRDDQVINIAENDGQQIRRCFTIRGNLYPCKESLHVVSDNGDDPQNWPVQLVSPSVGTLSIDGVSGGEGWMLVAARSGLYYFDGGFPQKISQEIQPTWDQIDWEQGHLLVLLVDVEQKRIFIQAPMKAQAEVIETDVDSL